jgi:hypothetical protein
MSLLPENIVKRGKKKERTREDKHNCPLALPMVLLPTANELPSQKM